MTDATTAPAADAPKVPKRGVGTVIREAILAGKDNAEALAAAKAEFPDSSTTAATISWYRNDLRKKGKDVPTARELAKKAAPAEGGEADPLG